MPVLNEVLNESRYKTECSPLLFHGFQASARAYSAVLESQFPPFESMVKKSVFAGEFLMGALPGRRLRGNG